MGCACSKSLQEVDHETAQIRARHSPVPDNGPTSAAFLQLASFQPTAAAVDTRSRRASSASSNASAALGTSGSSTGLSPSQWKQEDASLAAAGVQPLLLASLCLIESGGCPHAQQYRDHLGDVALGLCQMLLSTAQWLAGTKGFDRYGSCPTAAVLEQPKACVYYAAAYLSILAQHDGCRRGEAFIH
ncbi:hypothetical protein OEZ85_012783 [Tetradesmus obliquus]|uniref:Transglycosylase SLT domain-containing protein n=1 Tax=Tetradesmus obliquus TaxID=3088 RepID=A0ABY8U6K1_TETOB|nr:hypothetical protein OEZ85_012783 [Tetradesmus obliquus]